MPLPKPFETEDKFLRYCDTHSRTPRALFSGVHVNYLSKLMGLEPVYSDKELGDNPFYDIHFEEMEKILDIIKKRRNAVRAYC
ncbi:hypothetical protein LCGC14_2871930 [marine sediment metagenome]|uniref:Uncharacterized protein n=1 Tax=marine sediment metagenome TaxID=412755 RepID=A0A0F8YPE6_9ZZZZ